MAHGKQIQPSITAPVPGEARPIPDARPSRSEQVIHWLSRHWLTIVLVFFGLYVVLPWLAPVFMHWGWTAAANVIYIAYTPSCHQLPQRSFFLFGAKPMYTLREIQAAFRMTDNPLVLRQFIGTPEMGWKVAWSDRMVSMYGAIWASGLLYALFRRRVKPLSWKIGLLLVLPLALDGATHMLSDFWPIGTGFRDTNAWLAAMTNSAFPATFYAGDSLGSFNSWMRLLTGVLFGLGVVWFSFPHLDGMFWSIRPESHTRPIASRSC
ncbi:MAG: DUF2085 domain-containing protein [Chloroflexota bacterium]|nr:DUF2085 domain-containing protein [Chloroflexota bacterium]